MEEFERREKERAVKEKELSQFSEEFLTQAVSPEEQALIRLVVMNAVKEGKFEALVYSFPSSLCSDNGRAINNSDPNWPKTLQGKAREYYERYMSNARPKGYRLKAMIINFPDGVPGDVGFFLNWSPEV